MPDLPAQLRERAQQRLRRKYPVTYETRTIELEATPEWRAADEIERMAGLLRTGAPERVRHVKRGTTYAVLARGVRLQGDAHEPETVVLYLGEDGTLWAREEGEFDDGRFVPAGDAL